MQKGLAIAGLADLKITLHKLRHAAASLVIVGGANVQVVQTMLGHRKRRPDSLPSRPPRRLQPQPLRRDVFYMFSILVQALSGLHREPLTCVFTVGADGFEPPTSAL